MIASLRGPVLRVTALEAVIEAGSVGYIFAAPADTLAKLRPGEEAFVHIASVTSREGETNLFGFSDLQARQAFDTLRSVTGIGPRLALSILSALPADRLAQAIETKDEAALVAIPGVGKKSAQRMVLELAGKMQGGTTTPAAQPDVLSALQAMGWKERDAAAALEIAMKENPGADVPQMLRSALQVLGRNR